MKNLIIFLISLCTCTIWGQREWHVKPSDNNYHTDGNGLTAETAWSLQNALNNPGGVIHEGDIIWLHAGVVTNSCETCDRYLGNFIASEALVGTEDKYIIVKSYPGEWAVLDGNVFPYIAPVLDTEDLETLRENYGEPATPDEELETYRDSNQIPPNGIILDVQCKYVQFENFEITCIGDINRFQVTNQGGDDCDTLDGFHQMLGINHAPDRNDHTVNRYTNLIIHNIPGEGIGSWKYSDDSEIYGCILFNNGYILHQKKGTCSEPTFSTIGKGPGIYTQNASTDTAVMRLIRNNIMMNNYDSGALVWSQTEHPAEDYVKNYHISKNVFINNGSLQRDETANMIVKTGSLEENFNHPSNINIDNNIFYLNSRADNNSGLDIHNCESITINRNYFFKGTKCAYFSAINNNVTFEDNLYWGKHIELKATPAQFAAQNWNFNNNHYYPWNTTEELIFQVPATDTPFIRINLATFQSSTTGGYNSENGSTVYRVIGEHIHDPLLFINPDNAPPLPLDVMTFVTQNEFNPNVFYVTLFNSRGNLSANDIISVDFSDFNIPDDTHYTIRDAQNYFGTPITGTIDSNEVPFNMLLTDVAEPTGYYIDAPAHSAKDFGCFTIEFGCPELLINQAFTEHVDDTTTPVVYESKRTIILGPDYVIGDDSAVAADVVARAGKSIALLADTTIYSGSKFLAQIVDPCPDLVYNDEYEDTTYDRTRRTQTVAEKPVKQEIIKIFPNPSTGIFKIQSLVKAKIRQVEISSMYVKSIYRDSNQVKETVNIDISEKPTGTYVVKVTLDDGQIQTQTIIKK